MRSKAPLAHQDAGAALQDPGTGKPQLSATSHGHGVCRAGFREDTREAEAEQGCSVEATRVMVGQEQNHELIGDCRPPC